VLVQFANNTVTGRLLGKRDGGTQLFQVRTSVGVNMNAANGGDRAAAPHIASGNYGAIGNRPYRNGAVDGGAFVVWGGPSVTPVYIGALNSSGIATAFTTSDIHAVAIYNANPAAVQGQAGAISTAMGQL
jgi:hypothetical protein